MYVIHHRMSLSMERAREAKEAAEGPRMWSQLKSRLPLIPWGAVELGLHSNWSNLETRSWPLGTPKLDVNCRMPQVEEINT